MFLIAGCGGASSGSEDTAQDSAVTEAENTEDTETENASDASNATQLTLDSVAETARTEIATALETPVESMTIALTSPSFDTSPFTKPTPGLGPINYMLWAKPFFQTNAAGTLENGGIQPG